MAYGIGGSKKGKHAKAAPYDPAGPAQGSTQAEAPLPPTGQRRGSPLMGGHVPRFAPNDYSIMGTGGNTGIGSIGKAAPPAPDRHYFTGPGGWDYYSEPGANPNDPGDMAPRNFFLDMGFGTMEAPAPGGLGMDFGGPQGGYPDDRPPIRYDSSGNPILTDRNGNPMGGGPPEGNPFAGMGGGIPNPFTPNSGTAGPGSSGFNFPRPTPFNLDDLSFWGTDKWEAPGSGMFDLGYTINGGPLSNGAWKDPAYATDAIKKIINDSGGLWDPTSVLGDMQGQPMWSVDERMKKLYFDGMGKIPGPFGGSLMQPNMQGFNDWAKSFSVMDGGGGGNGTADPALLQKLMAAGASIMRPLAQEAAGYITPNEVESRGDLFNEYLGYNQQSPFAQLAEGWANSRDPNNPQAYDPSEMITRARDISGASQSNVERMLGDKWGNVMGQGGGQAGYGAEFADTIQRNMLESQQGAAQRSYDLFPDYARALGEHDPTFRSSEMAMDTNLAQLSEQGRRQIAQADTFGGLVRPLAGAVQGATGQGNSAAQNMPIEMWQSMLREVSPFLQNSPYQSADLLTTLGAMRNETLGSNIWGPGLGTAMQATQWGHERDMQRRASDGGGGIGGLAGGALGSFFGPIGTSLGTALGNAVGNAIDSPTPAAQPSTPQEFSTSIGNTADSMAGMDFGRAPMPAGRSPVGSYTNAMANTGPLDFGNPFSGNAMQQGVPFGGDPDGASLQALLQYLSGGGFF